MTLTAQEKRLRAAQVELSKLDPVPAQIVRLDDVRGLRNVYPVTFLDLPPGFGLCTEGMPAESMAVRMLRIMGVEQWRGQAFNEAMQHDHAANLMLMLMLSKHHKYTSIAAAAKDVEKMVLFKGEDQYREMETLSDLDASLSKFFDSLEASGCYKGGGVYLTRPRSSPNAEVNSFEMVVHPVLIGWKLPQSLVDFLLEKARERSEQPTPSHRPRHTA